MKYSIWMSRMTAIPKKSDFCLVDVTETVTARKYKFRFVIRESRKLSRPHRTASHPRIFLEFEVGKEIFSYELSDNDINRKFKYFVNYDLQQVYEQYPDVMEQAYESLVRKFQDTAERSRELVQTQIQSELSEVVTRKLTGMTKTGDDLPEYLQFKTLLKDQLEDKFTQLIYTPVKKLVTRQKAKPLLSLSFKEDQLIWQVSTIPGEEISIQWQSIILNPSIPGSIESLSTKDMYLASINMPMFAEIIMTRLNKIFHYVL